MNLFSIDNVNIYSANGEAIDSCLSKDVDYFFHGQANPFYGSNYITPNIQISEWFGMRGKGSIHHSEACCTGYLALEQAVNAVASGKYNVVLSGCVEFGDCIALPDCPAHIRKKFEDADFFESLKWIYDRAYTRPLMCGPNIHQDDAAAWYKSTYHLTDEEMDKLKLTEKENDSYTFLWKTYFDTINQRWNS